MANPQMHPEARTMFLEAMENVLFHKSRLRLHKELVGIIQANGSLVGNRQTSLNFQGKVYYYGVKPQAPKLLPGQKKPPVKPMNLLHADLRPRMRKHLQNVQGLDIECDRALGYLSTVMMQSSYADDIYKLLPASLHHTFQKMDRFFIQGTGKLCSEDVKLFVDENQKYIRLMKARLTYNLLDVVSV